MFFSPSPLRQLKSRSWRLRPVPAANRTVPTMLMDDELRLLSFLTERYYNFEGQIVDAGCFLGGSTVALASGLRANLARRRRRAERLIHSYDLFQVEDWTRGKYFPQEVAAGSTTRALYDANVAPFGDLLDVHEGDITQTHWQSGPIEILFIDVAKHWTVCDWITENFFPQLIPGRSVVVQQDYLYQEWTGWLHITMEYFHEHFEMLCDTTYNSVAFLFRKPFPPGAIRPGLVTGMPLDQAVALMDRAASRFHGFQRDLLVSAKRNYIELRQPL